MAGPTKKAPTKPLTKEEIDRRVKELLEKQKKPEMMPVIIHKRVATGTGSGVSDHGALTGLLDDDHTQYHNDARGDARYSQLGHTHTTGDLTDWPADAVGALTNDGAGNLSWVSGGGYTDEMAQDAVGGILTDSASIDFTYDDALNTITATVIQAGLDHGSIGGLLDDDHTQYHNDARGDARYYTETELDAGQLDTRYYTETETDTLLNTKQPDIQYQDEGVNQGTAGGVTTVNFTGAGVTASEAAGTLTVNITSGGVTDHGALTGLLDDDHTQYLLIDGTRAMTGTLDVAAGGGVSIRGASNETLLFQSRENSDGSATGFSFNMASALNTTGDTIFSVRNGAQSLYRAYVGSGPSIVHEYSDQSILGAANIFDVVCQAPGGKFRIRETSGSEYIEIANETGIKEIRTNVNGIQLVVEDGLAGERGVQMFSLGATHVFSPTIDDDTDLGNSSVGWRTAYINRYIDIPQTAAPANPSAGTRRIFVNSGTGELSVRTSGGTTVSLESSGGVTDHGALTGLGDDDHTIYALLAGRAGGQTLNGDTASGGNLILQSTAHATKGKVYLSASANNIFVDGANKLLSINQASPTASRLEIAETITSTGGTGVVTLKSVVIDPSAARSASTVLNDITLTTGASAHQKAGDAQCFRLTAGMNASDTGFMSYLFGLNLYVGSAAWSGGVPNNTTGYVTTETAGLRMTVSDNYTGTTALASLHGISVDLTMGGTGSASRTITDMIGLHMSLSSFLTTNKTNITNYAGIKLDFDTLGAFQRATFANTIGLDVSGFAAGANVTYTAAPEQIRLRSTTVANSIGIRQQGTTPHNRFNGACTIGADSAPETTLHLKGDPACMTIEEATSTPSNPASGSQVRMYMKADRIIFQYNDGGTVRYKSMLLTGTGSSWSHSTTPP